MRGEQRAFLLLAGPGLLLFGAFTFWPIAYSLYLSVFSEGVRGADRGFIGAANYLALLTDPDVRDVFVNTLVYSAVVVLTAQALAFGLAVLLNRRLPARVVWRALAFSPCVTTPVAAALVWVLLLDSEKGPMSAAYAAMGVAGPRWLASSSLALPALMAVGVWKEIAFATVFFLAGLQSVPKELYESLSLESDRAVDRLRCVTLPMLSPVIFFLLVSGFIAATKAFDVVAVMTQGGPVYPDSSMYVYHLYRTAFYDFAFGYASAMAVLFFALSLALIAAKFWIARRVVHYESGS